MGDKQINSFCLIHWLGLHGFGRGEPRGREGRRRRRRSPKIKVCLSLIQMSFVFIKRLGLSRT